LLAFTRPSGYLWIFPYHICCEQIDQNLLLSARLVSARPRRFLAVEYDHSSLLELFVGAVDPDSLNGETQQVALAHQRERLPSLFAQFGVEEEADIYGRARPELAEGLSGSVTLVPELAHHGLVESKLARRVEFAPLVPSRIEVGYPRSGVVLRLL